MKIHSIGILLLGIGLVGCEQEGQTLPFSTGIDETVSRSIPASGGLISTPAGASVHFPDGALSASTSVTLEVEAHPSALQQSGTAVSDAAFELTPAGMELGKPAVAELRFDPAVDPEQAWLASVVNLTPSGVEEVGQTRVDLSTGLVRSEISRLGTLAVVIPEPDAVFHVEPSSPVAAARVAVPPATETALLGGSGTDSVRVGCGGGENRCAGLRVEASHGLLERVHRVAAVYPQVEGALRIESAGASGTLAVRAPFRVKLQSGQTAENVVLEARVAPTAATTVRETSSEIVFTAMSFRVSGAAEDEQDVQETVGPLVIAKSDSIGWITVTRDFQVPNNDGSTEKASVSVVIPVQLY